MNNFRQVREYCKSFFKLKSEDRKTLLEALFLTAIVRLIVILFNFKRYSKYIGIYNTEAKFNADINQYKTIRKISWSVITISRFTPWESKCLVQAIVAQKMLKRRKLFSTLYLGVNKSKEDCLRAHAWLKCGQVFVTGQCNKDEFREVAKFSNSSVIIKS